MADTTPEVWEEIQDLVPVVYGGPYGGYPYGLGGEMESWLEVDE